MSNQVWPARAQPGVSKLIEVGPTLGESGPKFSEIGHRLIPGQSGRPIFQRLRGPRSGTQVEQRSVIAIAHSGRLHWLLCYPFLFAALLCPVPFSLVSALLCFVLFPLPRRIAAHDGCSFLRRRWSCGDVSPPQGYQNTPPEPHIRRSNKGMKALRSVLEDLRLQSDKLGVDLVAASPLGQVPAAPRPFSSPWHGPSCLPSRSGTRRGVREPSRAHRPLGRDPGPRTPGRLGPSMALTLTSYQFHILSQNFRTHFADGPFSGPLPTRIADCGSVSGNSANL